MARFQTSRILPIILVLVIIVIAVAAIVSLARVIFFSGAPAPAVSDVSRTALLDTSAHHSVRLIVRGPIVADEQFHSYQIVVTPTARTLTTYVGYLDTIVAQTQLPNSTAAYEEFVHALDKADLPDGTPLEGERNDTRGVCASELLYQFEILDGTNVVKQLWTSTCNQERGSLSAKVRPLLSLFITQIPDAKKLINDVDL